MDSPIIAKKDLDTLSYEDPSNSIVPEVEKKRKKKSRTVVKGERSPATKELGDVSTTKTEGLNIHDTSNSEKPAEDDFIPLPPSETKKSKKRKHTVSDEPELEAGISEPHKKKKKKHDKNLPDPSRDSSLTNQGQKALVYAYTHTRHPSKWKFHKARQNWLMRHYWSPTGIPDLYLPMIIEYLAQMQGGAHDKIIKTCRDKLAMDEVPIQPSADTKGEDSTAVEPPQPTAAAITRKTRAEALLAALESSPTHTPPVSLEK